MDRYPVDFYTPHPEEYVKMENEEVGLKLFGLTLLPHCRVWVPALNVPMNVRFLPDSEQLVKVLGAQVLS